MKKIMASILIAMSVLSLQAMGNDPVDICETELMACNNGCDTSNPTEACYEECREKYEACLADADTESNEADEQEEEESQKEE